MIRVLSFECIGNPNDNDITIDEAVISLFVCMYHSESVLDVCVSIEEHDKQGIINEKKKRENQNHMKKKRGPYNSIDAPPFPSSISPTWLSIKQPIPTPQ